MVEKKNVELEGVFEVEITEDNKKGLSVPGGTTQIPEGVQTSGAGEAGSAQEDKKPRPEVGEKSLHLDMYTLEVLKRADNETYGNIFSISAICELENGLTDHWKPGSSRKIYFRGKIDFGEETYEKTR